MKEQEPKGWTPIQDARNALTFLALAARVLAAPVEVMLRTRFGTRYFGLPSFLALFALPLWMVFWPGHNPEPICVFWLFFVLMQVRARLESTVMRLHGWTGHTRYNGWPRLAAVFRKTPEVRIKGAAEPVLVCLAGLLTVPLSPPLASYLVAAGLSIALSSSLIESVDRVRTEDLNDARIEQQQNAERFREMHRDRK